MQLYMIRESSKSDAQWCTIQYLQQVFPAPATLIIFSIFLPNRPSHELPKLDEIRFNFPKKLFH
jgi:hypothetical protein